MIYGKKDLIKHAEFVKAHAQGRPIQFYSSIGIWSRITDPYWHENVQYRIAPSPETDWYPSDVKPVRVGVYQRKDEKGQIWYSQWNGTTFQINCHTIEETFEEVWKHPTFQWNCEWRGVCA